MMISKIEAKNVLICSDLHLSPENLIITDFFCKWIISQCKNGDDQDKPEWVLILGDLFDRWIGDDQIKSGKDAAFRNVLNKLKKCFLSLKSLNISVGIMHGNRDFLMGSELLAHIHSQQLESEVKLISSGNKSGILLVHGDELCTDDTQHQIFRKLVKTNDWQNQFKSKSLIEREKIAESLRTKSEAGKKTKSKIIMDVNPLSADIFLKKNHADVLIHGHTHLPGKNILPSGKHRWVIANWTVDNYGKVNGGAIQVKRNEITQIST
jgi:UDP-2,3-diacylglucosamine hydrolase